VKLRNSPALFQKLKRLQEYLASQFPHTDFTELSMGTSGDYEVAVQGGATLVRVGTAIVGARQYKWRLDEFSFFYKRFLNFYMDCSVVILSFSAAHHLCAKHWTASLNHF
jgi:hypothetical protein